MKKSFPLRKLFLLQFAEFVEQQAVGEPDGDGEGQHGGGDTTHRHVEHQHEGVDGSHAPQEDTTQQERH